MFARVAKNLAAADRKYGGDVDATAKRFYGRLSRLEFLPNSPTLMNAGTPIQQLAACFVLPVEDSIEHIFDMVKLAAIVHRSGGGTGFSFSRIRPKGDYVEGTGGIASGPVSFMRVFDAGTEAIKQGGKRRGANMGILRVDHPDVEEFIACKADEASFRNFNLSVAATDRFMDAVRTGKSIELRNPATGAVTGSADARALFEKITTNAHRTGDPGLFFIDRTNAANPTPHAGAFEATNPCGEVPLLPFESCNLGSINLAAFERDGEIDKERLSDAVRDGVHFLDNVIDMNRHPVREIERITKANRKIGLGVMGFADLCVRLGVPYASRGALDVAEDVMSFLHREARDASAALAKERGAFPNFAGSALDRPGAPPLRNATVLTVAPTGTISLIAGVTSGIEPPFAIAYIREVLDGKRLVEVNAEIAGVLGERGLDAQPILRAAARTGTLEGVPGVPDDVRALFRTAHEIPPAHHVAVQAAFQKHVDNAVSKTVNLPPEATPEDVRTAYLRAYELGCKGITVYRAGSKRVDAVYKSEDVEKLLTDACDARCRLGI